MNQSQTYNVFDEDMWSFPLEWENPPQWLEWIDDQFNDANNWVHQGNYDRWFNKIQGDLHSWVLAGSWLYQVRRVKAYSLKFPNWQTFCEKALGMGVWQVNNYIKAARVFKDLAASGFTILPKNISQCLPLVHLRDHDLTETWEKVLKECPPHRLTQKAIESAIKGEPLQTKKRLEVPLPNWEQFEQKCRDAGKNPKEELDKLLGNYEPDDEPENDDDDDDEDTKPVDEEKLNDWFDDLKDLIEEERDQQTWLSKLTLWLFGGQVCQAIADLPPPPE